MDYFTSDWHFSHKNLCHSASRNFDNTEEMDKSIEDMIFSQAKRNDTIYFLGDLSFSREKAEDILKKLQKKKIHFHWILGNHDEKLPLKELAQYCDSMSARRVITRDKISIHLTHFPQTIWTNSFRNSYHLYGHVHKGSFELEELGKRMDGKCLCVNLEFHDFKMWTLEEIMEFMWKRHDNWDNLIYTEMKKENTK